IEREDRRATEQEKHVLARYTGWGAMPAAFDYYTGRADEWNDVRDTLKNLLTSKEHSAASASVSNAHYTSPLVINAVWSALERLGVGAGARILEPSIGVGNFFGLMPESFRPRALRAGIELDSITARIAKALYEDAAIFETGFEEAPFPDNFFDVAIGNVPFGNYGVHDPQYKSWQTASIHDYFFVKSLDKLREGGVLAFITSRYTMDKKDDIIRQHLASKADFLGAIRLPNTSFKDNAGTVVTTDIIFLQKRAQGKEPVGASWVNVEDYAAPEGDGTFPLNEYYIQNPQMMLGTMKLVHSRYAEQPELLGDITPELLQTAVAKLPQNIYAPRIEEPTPAPVPQMVLDESVFSGVKDGAYVVVDNVLGVRLGGIFTPADVKPKVESRIRGMMKVRDCVREVFRTQLADAGEKPILDARHNLTYAYDRFVREFGCLSNKENRRAFADDPDAPLLQSLESEYDESANKAKKAAIFEKRTLERYHPVISAETAAEALAVSLNEYGRLEWGRMAALTGQSVAALQRELGTLVYENPETGEWETADEYLSGNVRQKLATVRSAAALDKKYLRNIAPLEDVQPTDLLPNEITARLGATWIPTDDIADFVAEVIEASQTAVRVDYLADLSTWAVTVKEIVKSNVANITTYGTSRFTAVNLIEDALNGKVPTAYDSLQTPDGEKRVINERQTLEAREAQQKLKDKFVEWIWKDENRASRLAGIYNEKFNSIRLRTYDGSHLTFPNMNKTVLRDGELAPHQKNAVWRILQGDSTLLAHCVGAGKTWVMTAAAMEAKRIGLVKKSMMIVPNHLVDQWGKEFLSLYPQANIFVAGKDYFQSGNRQQAMSRIATGNYDAVIVSHTSFERLPLTTRQIFLTQKNRM
ncbi:MAG: DEAD/DEAH box helicase family protein, partial [Alphaproteobacteria bacterium]|nr:DEAD/DEAH box helicase family protein [Alphaproteobacteria bacterium]